MNALVPVVTFTRYESSSTSAHVTLPGRLAASSALLIVIVLLEAPGITIVPFVPAGAVIRMLNVEPVFSHAAIIVTHRRASLDKTLHITITGLSPRLQKPDKSLVSPTRTRDAGLGVPAGTTSFVDSLASPTAWGRTSVPKREIGKVRPSSGSGERRVRSPESPFPTVEVMIMPGTKLEFDYHDASFEIDEDLPNIGERRYRFRDLRLSREMVTVLARKSISSPARRMIGSMSSLMNERRRREWSRKALLRYPFTVDLVVNTIQDVEYEVRRALVLDNEVRAASLALARKCSGCGVKL
ncbi:hypothetical protein RSOLAG22IIIB_05667 [Rhizoctonia solani]|uniref:Uncharacterized protein n=1 Tax=Rhizoctonia solani TaxID=456999 RepID=A0A0K6G7U0_9AGAM|nr:hypothetical protein RSOLAG22IIIB_05667 [Rhizoctonia solani]